MDQIAWLIDTNVVSDVMRPHPEPQVAAFLDAIEKRRIGIASVTGKSSTESAASLRAVAEATLPTDSTISSPSYLRTGSSTGHWTTHGHARESWRTSAATASRSTIYVPVAFLAGAAASPGLSIVSRNTGEFSQHRHDDRRPLDTWSALITVHAWGRTRNPTTRDPAGTSSVASAPSPAAIRIAWWSCGCAGRHQRAAAAARSQARTLGTAASNTRS